MSHKFRVQDGIIFPDGTEQTTAGLQGIQGIQGTDGTKPKKGIIRAQRTDGLAGTWTFTTILGNISAEYVSNGTSIGLLSNSYMIVTLTGFQSLPSTIHWFNNKLTADGGQQDAQFLNYLNLDLLSGQGGLPDFGILDPGIPNALLTFEPNIHKFYFMLSTTSAQDYYFYFSNNEGIQGLQGIQGADGVQGSSGSNGTQGTAGTNGTQGTQGTAGSTGTQGTAGSTGTQGTAGSTGTQGTQGIQGITGPSGQGLINQTLILDNVAVVGSFTNQDVTTWSASYTGTGGQLLVNVDMTAWSSASALRNWYLKKNGTIVATGTMYFNNTFSHLSVPALKYIDTSGSTSAATWSIAVGSGLTADASDRCTITVTEYTGTTNINASSVTASGNVSGQMLVSTLSTGNEGGEIQLAVPQTNTSLVGSVKVDVYQNRFRIFEGSGSVKGAYIDLSQADAGVGTLLNNRVAALVNAGTFVTMDNIKATVTTSGNRGLSLASVSGSFNANIAGHFFMVGPSSGGAAGTQTITTTASASVFNWGFGNTADSSVYIITDTTNSRAYRITLQIGASYNNNMISIERLV